MVAFAELFSLMNNRSVKFYFALTGLQTKIVICKFMIVLNHFKLLSLRFDGEVFSQALNSTHAHRATNSIASFKGAPFITGSYDPSHAQTEIMDLISMDWIEAENYPFASLYV